MVSEHRAASLSTLWRYITRTCQTKLMRSIPFWADKRPSSNLYKTFYVYSGSRAFALNAAQLCSINTDITEAKALSFPILCIAFYFRVREMLWYKHQAKHKFRKLQSNAKEFVGIKFCILGLERAIFVVGLGHFEKRSDYSDFSGLLICNRVWIRRDNVSLFELRSSNWKE